jgi:hypothetical protein
MNLIALIEAETAIALLTFITIVAVAATRRTR